MFYQLEKNNNNISIPNKLFLNTQHFLNVNIYDITYTINKYLKINH